MTNEPVTTYIVSVFEKPALAHGPGNKGQSQGRGHGERDRQGRQDRRNYAEKALKPATIKSGPVGCPVQECGETSHDVWSFPPIRGPAQYAARRERYDCQIPTKLVLFE